MPLKTDYKHIQRDDFFAYCNLCRDTQGEVTRFDVRWIARHVATQRHQAALHRSEAGKVAKRSTSVPNETPTNIQDTSTKAQSGNNQPKSPYRGPVFSYHATSTALPFTGTDFSPEYSSGYNSDTSTSSSSDSVNDLYHRSTKDRSGASSPDIPDCSEDEESTDDEDGLFPAGASAQKSRSHTASSSNEWAPWPSKEYFLADGLANSPRNRFTRSQLKLTFHFARQCGARNVPSLKALKRFQAECKRKFGDPKMRMTTASGKVYYMNRIAHGLGRDFSNSELRPQMVFYPHFNNKKMSQAWHGRKLLEETPDHQLTPMMRAGKRIYYINELVKRIEGWFLPLRFILYGHSCEPYAFGFRVEETECGLKILDGHRALVPIATFRESYPELLQDDAVPAFDDGSRHFQANMPHPLRAKAQSRPVYSVPVIIFIDDVSGNISKQWGKHHCVYVSNGALPRESLSRESSVQFVLTSANASPLELMQGVKHDIEQSFIEPVVAYDCSTHEEVLVRPFPLFFPADNPMQAEEADGQPLNAGKNCRTCVSGGNEEQKRTEDGYAALFEPNSLRDPSKTLEQVNHLLELATKPGQKTKIKQLSSQWGVKDTLAWGVIEKLQKKAKRLRKPQRGEHRLSDAQITAILQEDLAAARIKGCVNPLLEMEGVDIHKDTPTEILHTVLLGVVKYFWCQTTYVLEKGGRLEDLEARLASVSVVGLNLGPIPARYMCTYSGSLVGRHFKLLAQIMPFVGINLIEGDLLDVWLLIGHLVVMLWQTEIVEINAYLDELKLVINDLLTAVSRCSPSIIVSKPKFHFLVHLPFFIKRFGPALLFSTERFESFHGVFRSASTHSNRHAPSFDIAESISGLDRIKHICSGGFWRDGSSWVCASPMVRSFVKQNKDFASLIGLPKVISHIPGSVSHFSSTTMYRQSQAYKPCPNWAQLHRIHNLGSIIAPGAPQDKYIPIMSFISQTGDRVQWDNDVLYGANIGRIKLLFGCESRTQGCQYFAVLTCYTVHAVNHPVFGMPVLIEKDEMRCIRIEDIICVVNLQHDCGNQGQCVVQPNAASPNASSSSRHRHEELTIPTHLLTHGDDRQFILNTCGLHNAEVIRRALAPTLFQRQRLSANAVEVRRRAVSTLVAANKQKKVVAKAKKAAQVALKTALASDLECQSSRPSPEPSERPKRKRRRRHSAALSNASD